MRLVKTYDFDGIRGYELGWSLAGPPWMTTYLYVVDRTMIDTGQAHMGKEVLEISKSCRVEQVLLTHHHEDHSGNAARIQGELNISVFGHPMTVEKMKKPFKILPYQHYIWGATSPLHMVENLPEMQTNNDCLIPVYAPGHSKDHTVYLMPQRGVLFSGDLYLADKIKIFRSDEFVFDQIMSLKQILTLEF
ncbi:MAG: MBL fold metallo-hydrolase, partial [Desulfobacteraceae bacterium]|nr:MBL fold metallo-hydrolase [Desulfobacteraceae bacterium]